MNILFLLRSLDMGGVEVVTAILANKFCSEGHHVFVFSFYNGLGNVKERFGENIQITVGEGYFDSKENVALLRSLLQEQEIDVIINQWGLPQIPIRVINKARRGMDVKLISAYHNDPMQNSRVQSVEATIAKTENLFKRALLKVKRFVFRCVTGCSMGYTYTHSDKFAVLSPVFISNFKKFTKIKNCNKLIVQTNPVTVSSEGYIYNVERKQKEIIYVGRLDYTQKRTYRLIDIWARLEQRFPDWRLTIVGDGEERDKMERMVSSMKLQRVSFEGFQHPKPYYERASILLLTSEFEGWGLVLPECMSFGVVPIVYGSYSAVYDIIDNGKNGLVLPYDKSGFRAEQMARLLETVMKDKDVRNKMAMEAIQKSKEYSLDMIYQQWMKVLNALATI